MTVDFCLIVPPKSMVFLTPSFRVDFKLGVELVFPANFLGGPPCMLESLLVLCAGPVVAGGLEVAAPDLYP